MKLNLGVITLLIALLLGEEVEAQSFAFADVSPTSFDLGGGTAFGRGRVQPGFCLDARHAFSLNKLALDAEAYGTLVVRLAPTWFLLNNLGAGATINDSTVWSARALFILTGTAPVSLRASIFAMWTPQNDGILLSARIGPTIRLGDTAFRIYPNLALSVGIPGTDRSANVAVTPGVTLFLNW